MELDRRPREDGARTDRQPQKRRGRRTPGGSSLDGGLIDDLRRFPPTQPTSACCRAAHDLGDVADAQTKSHVTSLTM
jgi:hypothetical protein